ncbi:hypothetical protein CUJ83_03305 [Methanocella sp. CWC-04]|uniref:Carboxypeptidase regulatory-like domain-containing protein n=1 Tax=Methanooceanicella nereidis TaxID=2052831 RepID=A0AAP2RBS6_9EURY|nr:carboxypeptidase-like regulatory domain-containing protein [Methanocella sp. CWC-04]MCD1294021.1 hypothetical protein [Methanocella sp. CWC-04]
MSGNKINARGSFVLLSLILLTLTALTGFDCVIEDAHALVTATKPVVTGSLSGKVLDIYDNGVPNAKVTLYVCVRNSDGTYKNKNVLYIENNPQMTSDGVSIKGLYTFTNVPKGTYNMTVEKDGKKVSSIVDVAEGTTTLMITLTDYVYKLPTPTPTPRPTPMPTVTPTPAPVISATPHPSATATTAASPDTGEDGVAGSVKGILVSAVGIQFLLTIVILTLLYITKKI